MCQMFLLMNKSQANPENVCLEAKVHEGNVVSRGLSKGCKNENL